MFENFKERFLNLITSRLFVLVIVFCLLCGTLIHRVFTLQIVHGAEYMDNFKLKIRKERYIASTRGNIYDRNGELLAYNELSYNVTIEDVLTDNIYNDLGFMIGNELLILVEAQSIWTVNIIIRALMYLTQTYHNYLSVSSRVYIKAKKYRYQYLSFM